MASPVLCLCACHVEARGDANALDNTLDHTIDWLNPVRYGAIHREKYDAERAAERFAGVPVDDECHAFLACPACQGQHCAALLPPPPPARERAEWQEPTNTGTPQADGTGGPDDGN